MPKKRTTGAEFASRMLVEKNQRELHCVFVNLEKADNRVQRGALVLYEEVWSNRRVLERCRTCMKALRQWGGLLLV